MIQHWSIMFFITNRLFFIMCFSGSAFRPTKKGVQSGWTGRTVKPAMFFGWTWLKSCQSALERKFSYQIGLRIPQYVMGEIRSIFIAMEPQPLCTLIPDGKCSWWMILWRTSHAISNSVTWHLNTLFLTIAQRIQPEWCCSGWWRYALMCHLVSHSLVLGFVNNALILIQLACGLLVTFP